MISRGKRTQTSPENIVFHSQADTVDDHTMDGGVEIGEEPRFQEKLAKAVKVFETYKDGRRFTDRVSLDILRTMCRDRGLEITGYKINLFTRLKVWVSWILYRLLSATRLNMNFQREGNIPRPEATETGPTSGAVLGRDVMEEVWKDMKLTEIPSWMSPAPPNWGAAARGKLTADQWMVVCTVHLPVTLVRLWGGLTDRRYNLLCNFMDLTSAIQLATQRSITPQMIEDHERLITRYLEEMKELFKGNKIQPIHHVALHTGDFLRLFGPTHAVQAFGGERFLEVLGMQNVNNKSGTLLICLDDPQDKPLIQRHRRT